MERLKTYLGVLLLFAFLGLAAGSGVGFVAAIAAGIAGWVDSDGSMILLFGSCGVGALLGTVSGVAYQTAGARDRREQRQADPATRAAQRRREERAARRAERRPGQRDAALVVAVCFVGAVAFLSFVVSSVLGVMALLDLDDARHIAVGVAFGVLLGLALIVLVLRSTQQRRGHGRFGGFDGGPDLFDGGNDY